MKNLMKYLLGLGGYQLSRIDIVENPQKSRPITPEHFFDMYFSRVNPKEFFFVQIGANDGKTRDLFHPYIRRYQLSGIVIEPQKEVFDSLVSTYAQHSNIICANVAIGDSDGTQYLYRVKERFITDTNRFEVTAIASFNRDVFNQTLQKRLGKLIERVSDTLEDYTETVPVPTVTLETLFRQYNVARVDAFILDCEGRDFDIIRQIDFKRFTPSLINYESKFLSQDERASCERLLESHEYQLFRHGNDTCAFR